MPDHDLPPPPPSERVSRPDGPGTVEGMQAAGFEIDTFIAHKVVRVVVRGELDMAAREVLVDEAAAAVERGDDGTILELDLRDVTFADSSGLTGLVRCCRLTPGRRAVLIDPPPAVLGPLRRTGLDALFVEQPDE